MLILVEELVGDKRFQSTVGMSCHAKASDRSIKIGTGDEKSIMTIKETCQVGIGTETPVAVLDVEQKERDGYAVRIITSGDNLASANAVLIQNDSIAVPDLQDALIKIAQASHSHWGAKIENSLDEGKGLWVVGSPGTLTGQEALLFRVSRGEELELFHVDGGTGQTWAEEFRSSGFRVQTEKWQRDVFDRIADHRSLSPLDETADFIEQNRKLPGLDEANFDQQLVAENGFDLASLSHFLLKNIEEHTLYLIGLKEKLSETSTSTDASRVRIREIDSELLTLNGIVEELRADHDTTSPEKIAEILAQLESFGIELNGITSELASIVNRTGKLESSVGELESKNFQTQIDEILAAITEFPVTELFEHLEQVENTVQSIGSALEGLPLDGFRRRIEKLESDLESLRNDSTAKTDSLSTELNSTTNLAKSLQGKIGNVDFIRLTQDIASNRIAIEALEEGVGGANLLNTLQQHIVDINLLKEKSNNLDSSVTDKVSSLENRISDLSAIVRSIPLQDTQNSLLDLAQRVEVAESKIELFSLDKIQEDISVLGDRVSNAENGKADSQTVDLLITDVGNLQSIEEVVNEIDKLLANVKLEDLQEVPVLQTKVERTEDQLDQVDLNVMDQAIRNSRTRINTLKSSNDSISRQLENVRQSFDDFGKHFDNDLEEIRRAIADIEDRLRNIQ